MSYKKLSTSLGSLLLVLRRSKNWEAFRKRASIGMESDGSLLDGASLANEWSLPVLPEGVDYTTAVSVATHTHTHILCIAN